MKKTVYIPIGVGTFHLESAREAFEQSKKLLFSLDPDTVVPEDILLTIDALDAYLDTIPEEPSLVILQNVTFANAAYATEVFARFHESPVLLWTLREPVIDGTRLRLNSLTGAYSASNAYHHFRQEPLQYVFGAPGEDETRFRIQAVIRAAALKEKLRHLRIAAVGHTPEGFGFGRALDEDMRTVFGVTLESIEARELIERARSYSDADIAADLADAEKRTVGLEQTPERNRLDFARLARAYREYVAEHHIGALASRCWPDFFTAFGTPVCTVLGILNDLGVAAACEADTYGALSMYLGMQLTDSPCFFGDPVSMDEKENTVTFWHCGTAACSLARTDTGAVIGEHCNRHIGPTLEFGCRPAKHVTIFRVGRDSTGHFRFLLAPGEALDRPKQFYGTSVVVETVHDAKDLIYTTVTEGWEPHYAVIYGDVTAELSVLGDMLGLPVEIFA